MRLTPSLRWRRRIAYVLLLLYMTGLFAWQAQTTSQRRHDNCVSRRDLYDGQFVMVHFLAGQFHATAEQENAAVIRLRRTVHARPDC